MLLGLAASRIVIIMIILFIRELCHGEPVRGLVYNNLLFWLEGLTNILGLFSILHSAPMPMHLSFNQFTFHRCC